jgi:tetratricopeptide (TPR) repeat protein
MPAILRLTLAVTTLAVFWLALFVSNAGNTSPAAAPVTATADPAGAAGTPDATAAETEADAARIDSLLVESRDAFASGRWQDALEPTKAIAARFPGQHVYLARLAEIYNKLERPADEAATWELFMDRAPLPAEACPAVGNAYRRIGKYDLALKAFERCFDADRKNAELAFFVGLGNEWLTRFGAAEEFYQRAISIATTHFDSEVGLARLRLHRNQLAEALTRASAVLKKSPKHVDALLVAGLAEQRAGHRAEARVHLERAATLSKDYFDVHLALGVLDYSESRFPEARRRFEIANTLDPKRTDEVRVWLERTAKVKATS